MTLYFSIELLKPLHRIEERVQKFTRRPAPMMTGKRYFTMTTRCVPLRERACSTTRAFDDTRVPRARPRHARVSRFRVGRRTRWRQHYAGKKEMPAFAYYYITSRRFRRRPDRPMPIASAAARRHAAPPRRRRRRFHCFRKCSRPLHSPRKPR